MGVTEAASKPRKTPKQARSNASVSAILQATVQVLRKEGVAKITTKKIAARAGVSVGTLYQYFPNKSSLLHVLVEQQLELFEMNFSKACLALRGVELTEMAGTLASAFVKAKFGDADTSIALYAAAGDSDGCRMSRTRTSAVLADTISSASDRTVIDPLRVARMLLSAMAGISREIIAADQNQKKLGEMEQELARLLYTYLLGSSTLKPDSARVEESALRC